MLRMKGFEVELYTGTPSGHAIGLANDIAAEIPNFVCEPDNRNVEYTTPPLTPYESLLDALLKPRQALRRYLRSLGHYTIVPGSTLSLRNTGRFHRSTPDNAYHTYIEQTYGTNVVTASVHINIGIDDVELLLRACRLIRMEAPLYLALSASSPFLNGKATRWHSTRWHLFPQTPAEVPLFATHQEFVLWTHDQLTTGTMQNVRHLWCSVRPNGPDRPHRLNRLELRICDLVLDPIALLAITALLELRILMLLQAPEPSTLDPIIPANSVFTVDELTAIAAHNESAAALNSLDARMIHWQTGDIILARDWIASLYQQVQDLAEEHELGHWLAPILQILSNGNEAQRWLQRHAEGDSPEAILRQAIQTAELREAALMNAIWVAKTPRIEGWNHSVRSPH